jgi:hypothetical protein
VYLYLKLLNSPGIAITALLAVSQRAQTVPFFATKTIWASQTKDFKRQIASNAVCFLEKY